LQRSNISAFIELSLRIFQGGKYLHPPSIFPPEHNKLGYI
jgi:hypothetical protein